MEKSNYWIDRIANDTYKTYNSLEEKNRALMEMYQEASLNMQEELYSVTQKINSGKGVTLSDMHKFNRLSGLKKNIESTLEKLAENVEKFGTVNMVNAGKSVYKNVMGQIAGTSFDVPNQRVMEEMLNRPWHGDTFSKRLWKNTQVLASNLNEILTIGLTQGKTIAEIAIQLNNRMNAGFNTSHRLIRTETMHYLNESAFKAYKDSGCEEVEVYCAKDERTCEVCGKKHGKKYSIDKRPVLPFHPNCRCTYLPIVNMKKVEENNKNNVSNSVNSDIIKENKIEMLRKDDKRDGYTFISDEVFNRLIIKARKNGAMIIRGTKEVEEHLDIVGAAASNIGDVILFRKDVCISEVLEETYHFEQNLKGLNNDKPEPIRSILNEIDAKEYLLDNAVKFKIPRNEIELTKRQLESYKEQLKSLKGSD